MAACPLAHGSTASSCTADCSARCGDVVAAGESQNSEGSVAFGTVAAVVVAGFAMAVVAAVSVHRFQKRYRRQPPQHDTLLEASGGEPRVPVESESIEMFSHNESYTRLATV
jgi:hypothetical protein